MNTEILIILALICLFIGLLAGILIGILFRGNPGQTRQIKREKSGLVEVVRFWSDAEGKQIVSEVGGKFIRSLDELKPVQRARLLNLLERMRAGTTASAGVPKPASANQTAGGIPSKDEKPIRSEVAVDILAAQPPAQRPKGDLVSVLANVLQPETRAPLPVEKSIAAQIDEVLQVKLEGTALAQKGVRLMELPGKGMVVMVGLDQYDGVSDVPDPEIQEIIHTAVTEWETKVSASQD